MSKIERIFYGMVNGKITQDKTSGVTSLLTDSQIAYIRGLTVEDSDRYLYFKENHPQVIAVPKIINVFDPDSKRTWVQNETRIMTVKDYLDITSPVKVMFNSSPLLEVKELPSQFTPIIV